MTRLVRMLGIMMLAVAGAACSGGSGVEPAPAANDAVEPAPAEPNNPPTPTEPSVPPGPPVAPPPSTNPPPKSPTAPTPTVPKPSAPVPPAPTAPVEPSPMAGIWDGASHNNDRVLVGAVLPSKQTWVIYSRQTDERAVEGFILGASDTSGDGDPAVGRTPWTMGQASMINVNTNTRTTINATGTWWRNGTFAGQFQNASSSSPLPSEAPTGMHLAWLTESGLPFRLDAAAGRYFGIVPPVEGMVTIDLTVSGAIIGASPDGCRFTGSAIPNGTIANVTILFNGAPCRHANVTVRGIVTPGGGGYSSIAIAGISQDQQTAWAFMGHR